MAFKVKIEMAVVKKNLIFLVFAWFTISLFLGSKNIPQCWNVTGNRYSTMKEQIR